MFEAFFTRRFVWHSNREHVAWPQAVLEAYLPLLRPGGRVLVSLPNVGLWSARFSHLLGKWDYAETGVLDRTHLRFFTARSARELLEGAKLTVRRRGITPGLARPFIPLAKRILARPTADGAHDPEAMLKSGSYCFYVKHLYPLERALACLWPGMLAFQMLFEAERQ